MAEARREMVARTVGQLADASSAAAVTLRALLNAEADTVRLGAARAILELGTKLRESEDLERRLSELEAKYEAAEPQRGQQGWRRHWGA